MLSNSVHTKTSVSIFSLVASGVILTACPEVAAAAEPDPNAAQAPSEIIVSARKRDESLLDVPVAITALPAEELEKKNITTLEDVSRFAPSITVSSYGASIANRSQQTITIRGMTKSGSANPTTTVFINGAPIGGGGIVDAISDLQQVEVIKGPQAAYFGRSTFAGAVNLITREPADELRVKFDGLYGSYNWVDTRLTLEGPIIEDVLKARISGRYYSIDGQYKNVNSPSEPFGAQSSKNLSAEIMFTPTSNLTVRAFGTYIEMDDGPSGVLKYGVDNYNCNLGGAAAGTFNYICGTLSMDNALPLGMNLNLSDRFVDDILGNEMRPKDIGLDGVGNKAEIKIGTLTIDYEIPGTDMTFTSVTAYNSTYSDSITDLSNEYLPDDSLERWFWDTYNVSDAFNQEVRLSSGNSGRFKWSLGANYVRAKAGQYNAGLGANYPGDGSIETVLYIVSGGTKPTENKTLGFFGAASYDFTDWLTLNLEGRYQIDKTTGFLQELNASGEIVDVKAEGATNTAKNFLPRAILQIKPTPDSQIYATYSKGVNPGTFNSSLTSYSSEMLELIAQETGGASIAVKEEKLDNYEIGFKGAFFDNHLTVDISAYYAKWKNQVVSGSFIIVDPVLAPAPGELINAVSNVGDTDLKGIEASLFYDSKMGVTLEASGSINDSKIKTYKDTRSSNLLGADATANDVFAGNELPNYSKYSANFGASYTTPASDTADFYMRADYSYRSGVWASVINAAKTQDAHIVSARAGIATEHQKVEFFAENLLDNRAPMGVSQNVNVLAYAQYNYSQAVITGQLRMPRRIGIRVSSEF